MPRSQSEIPSTLRRSPRKAQETFRAVRASAEKEYGEGQRASRTAFAVLKRSFEKVGDHWAPKKKKGPSDPRSKMPTRAKRQGKGETFGGVDLYGHTRVELLERARKLGVTGISRMNKRELARVIARKQ